MIESFFTDDGFLRENLLHGLPYVLEVQFSSR